MKISNEVKVLLDKLYNLRGEDSVILAKMNKEKEEAIETRERTKNEKSVLLEKIDKLTKEEQTLADEGKKLSQVLGSINRDDFANVLDRLQIDFNPADLNDKLNTLLPSTIEKVVSENKSASEELQNVEAEMDNAVTKLEELSIRKDEALSNQEKLNEYFDLALSGNINITRDAITSLLERFEFNENEQREAAKILMFPEDALYEYDAKFKSNPVSGKTITEVLVQAKAESKEITEPQVKDEVIASSKEDSKLEAIFDKVVEENIAPQAPVEEVKEEVVDTVSDKQRVVELLESYNIRGLNDSEIEKILTDYDEEVIKSNIEILNNHHINLDILRENAQILNDKELSGKLDKLMSIGKDASDISLMPEVLVKYDLNGLNNTINLLQISGLDPKKVPLMAY